MHFEILEHNVHTISNMCTLCAFVHTFHSLKPKEYHVPSLPSRDPRTLSEFHDGKLTVPLALQVVAE